MNKPSELVPRIRQIVLMLDSVRVTANGMLAEIIDLTPSEKEQLVSMRDAAHIAMDKLRGF